MSAPPTLAAPNKLREQRQRAVADDQFVTELNGRAPVCSMLWSSVRVRTVFGSRATTKRFHFFLGNSGPHAERAHSVTCIIPLENHAILSIHVAMVRYLGVYVMRRQVFEATQNLR